MPVTVIDQIAPKNNGDFGITQDTFLIGGWRSVADVATRNAIPAQRRTQGMRVRVVSDLQTYELVGGIDNANWVVVAGGSIIPNAIAESLTFEIDPINGNVPSTLFVTQSQVDANGPVKTMADAIESLPDNIGYSVTFEHVDGTHQLDERCLGSWQRFNLLDTDLGQYPAISGQFFIKSKNGLQRISDTPQMNIQSAIRGVSHYEFTMSADPGLIDNEYRFYFMRVVSGTGAGTIHTIVQHSGSFFKIVYADQALPDATSVVEIVDASTTLDFSTTGAFFTELWMPRGSYYGFANFESINIDWGGTWGVLENGGFYFDFGCRLYNAYGFGPWLGGEFWALSCTVDATNNVLGAAVLVDTGGSRSAFARLFVGFACGNASNYGYGLDGSGIVIRGMTDASIAEVYIFRAAIENCEGSGIKLWGPNAQAHLSVKFVCDNVQKYCVDLWKGPTLSVVYSSHYGTGNLGEVRIDNEEVTWLDVRSNGVTNGRNGSRVVNDGTGLPP